MSCLLITFGYTVIMLKTTNLHIVTKSTSVCKNLTIDFPTQGVVGILGPNGSGKTTLLHCLAGLHAEQSGAVMLANKNCNSYKPCELATIMALLLQDSLFEFPATVYDTVILGSYPNRNYWAKHRNQQQQLLKKILACFELTDVKQRCVTTLSGGERRRVSLAMIAMQQPEIYLLDEPTNHLDIQHQIKTLNYFTQLNKLIIMSLHDINLAKHYCTHILLLINGEYRFGTIHDILTLDLLQTAYRVDASCLSLWQTPTFPVEK